ncbi:hypothetical protein ACF0H5_001011 [Mactra antiquata]
MPSILTCMNYDLVLMFFSFFSQLLGYAVPSWMHIQLNSFATDIFGDSPLNGEGTSHLSYALWYATLCDGVCVTKTYFQINKQHVTDMYHDDINYRSTDKYSGFPLTRIVEFQIEATLALVFAYLALHTTRKQKIKYLHYFAGKRQDRPSPRRHCLIFFLAITSGILILIPFTHLADLNIHLKTIEDADNGIYKVWIPYGLILSGVGGVLSILSCISMLCTLCCTRSEPNRDIQAERGHDECPEDPNNHVRIQLVPLAPPINQNGRGYADPAAPGYVPIWEHMPSYSGSNIHGRDTIVAADFSHEIVPGEDTRFIPASDNVGGAYEDPPPSYDEVMRSGNYAT